MKYIDNHNHYTLYLTKNLNHPFPVFSEYMCLPKYELLVLEENRRGLLKNTYWYFSYRSYLEGKKEKVFNRKDVSLLDTLQLASLEAACWQKANLKDEKDDDATPASAATSTLPVEPKPRLAK